MTRDDIQQLIYNGVLPPSAIDDPAFISDLDRAIFEGALDINWESSAPFYDQAQVQIQQDVWAPDIPSFDPPIESGGGFGGGGALPPEILAELPPQRISLDVTAPDIAAPSTPPVQGTIPNQGAEPVTLNDLFGTTISALQNPLTDIKTDLEAANAIKQLFGVNPTGQSADTTVYTAAPMTIDVYAKGSGCRSGQHLSKAGKYKGQCRPNRHMNMLNPKALARATRRLAGFQHFATKTEKVIRHMFTKAGVKPAHRIGGKCGTCRKTRCSCG